MTVESLWSILSTPEQSGIPSSIKSVAIDVPTLIIAAKTSPSLKLLHNFPHLYLSFVRIMYLLLAGISPIFVFEGRTSNELHEAQQSLLPLLEAFGIPHIQAPAEAEIVCSKLSKDRLVDAVITSDSDALLYGARKVIKNFTVDNCRSGKVLVYDAENLEAIDGTKMGRSNLIA